MGKTLTRLCFLLLLVALPRAAEARVWYVDNSAAEGGDGRGTTPFQRLKQAEEAAGPGDSIMIAVGDGTARGQDEGIVLKEGQKLVARPADLDDGRRPIITNRDGDGKLPVWEKRPSYAAYSRGYSLLSRSGTKVLVGRSEQRRGSDVPGSR